MVHVSLRTGIAAVCLFLTAALSLASLLITLKFAREAMEKLALNYVDAESARATSEIENHVQLSVVGIQYLQNWAARQALKSPKADREAAGIFATREQFDPNEGQQWLDVQAFGVGRQGHYEREERLGVVFADGTTYGGGKVPVLPGIFLEWRAQYVNKSAAFGYAQGVIPTPATRDNPQGVQEILQQYALWLSPMQPSLYDHFNLPNKKWFPKPGTLLWSNLTRFVSTALTLFGPLYNKFGEEIGFAFHDMPTDMTKLLETLAPTDGANVFLIDHDGRVIGSTMQRSSVVTIALNETHLYNGNVAHDCVGNTNFDWETPNLVCIMHARDFHPTLAALWNQGKLAGTESYTGLDHGSYIGIHTVNTESQEQTTIPNMDWKVVVLYDEDSVHEDITRARFISIGVVVAIAAVCLALAITVIHVVMKPLEAVAVDMERVATMQNLNDATAPELSHLEEVYSVQQSFAALKNHLVLIRSYLPHTLLVKLDRGENPDDFGAAMEEELDESLSSVTSGSSRVEATKRTVSATPSSDVAVMNLDESFKRSASSITSIPTSPKRRGSSSTNTSFSRESSVRDDSLPLRVAAATPPGRIPSFVVKGSILDTSNRSRLGMPTRTIDTQKAHPHMTRKKVTILAINIRDFHTLDRNDGFAQHYEAITQQVYNCVVKHSGTIVDYSGDHFVVAFNAVTAVGSHAVEACKTALALRSVFELDDGMSALSAGIASGAVIVGNLGCQHMRHTQVIGAAYTQATVCERLCKLYKGVNIVATNAVARDACGFVEFQNVDIVDLPKARRCVISAVMDVKQAGAADEWMYQMQDSEDKSPFAAINRGFELYMAGDTEKALKVVNAVESVDAPLMGRDKLLTLLREYPDEGTGYASAMASFYYECLL